MNGQCPACKARQLDTLLCKLCTSQVADALRLVAPAKQAELPHIEQTRPGEAHGRQTLPWERQRATWLGFDAELEVSIARLGRSARNLGGGVAAEQPTPYDEGASTAARHLRAVLARWVMEIHQPGDDWPVDEIPHLAEFLLERINRIRGHDDCSIAYNEITHAVGMVIKAIDARPGKKTEPVTIEPEIISAALLTRAEACALFGIAKNRFHNWVSRGRIEPVTIDRLGRQLFQVADVQALLCRCTTPHLPCEVPRPLAS